MKKLILSLSIFLLTVSVYAANVNKIDPPFWYVGMNNPQLQLMVYGDGIGDATVTVNYPGVYISNTVRVESKNYLLVYLNLEKDVKPGIVNLTFTQGKKKTVKGYELRTREKDPAERMGFDASDALYLLMPDRFANGDPSNDMIEGLAPYTVNRSEPNVRHGGDLAGIEQHLDYFTDLGVTALWFTPILENSMTGGSYHGYATTDYYRVDPRFGTNEEYRSLISKCHGRDIKIVMDMIFNHCGVEHPWIKDMPSRDWFNNPDHETNFVQTSFRLPPMVDPYASEYDFWKMNDGWFVTAMPDLNQKNPHVYRYLVQNSFWWIEYSGIDGIRMDTYPYADYDAMSNWMKELNEQYPNYNVVGETWVTEPAYTAWWQKDSKISAPLNSHLKSVMDFSFFEKINMANEEQTDDFGQGLNRIYNNFVYDFLYPNPEMVLAFYENHDTERFLRETQDLTKLKQAVTLLLTTRRIPQLYYGTEVMMNGIRKGSDGHIRQDFPGGWAGDGSNAFTAQGRTQIQNESFNFYRTLLHWRKGNDVIAKGSMVQFMPQHGVYVYARQHEGKTVLVILNGKDSEVTLPLHVYKEVLKDKKQGKDVITGRTIGLDNKLKMTARESLVIEL
ncbi:glycoside hydrolase family 13 protein [Bacteroides sp. 519]|uniref:glycoside hydrolase family 13 protein n=1 Tax=Bacteroides sp. 519 TaxID=2302937 RepID=UPI0013D187BF|nr:glycoside hydrolase family 13 protein [Bacteroides sp. 519]NDV59837.1 alpha-amylase [Bacteroides sp. 519]